MKNGEGKDHFDLLPFIAILMCVLGCLLLVTMSIAALSIGPGAGEGWIPERGRQNTSKTPVLIEWDGTNATFELQGRRVRAKWSEPPRILLDGVWYLAPTNSRALNPDVQKLLDELAQRRATHYALFAVRPSGFESFNRFLYQFRDRQIDVGYEPIQQSKSVRLLQEKTQP